MNLTFVVEYSYTPSSSYLKAAASLSLKQKGLVSIAQNLLLKTCRQYRVIIARHITDRAPHVPGLYTIPHQTYALIAITDIPNK